MKKALIILLSAFCFFSCIKKKALKYDPDLVGTWVSNQDSIYTWLIIDPEGKGIYRTYEEPNRDFKYIGEVKYSLFELKMWVGTTKFKVKEWLTERLDGVKDISTKEYETLNNIKYYVDRRMTLKTTHKIAFRTVTLYRVKN